MEGAAPSGADAAPPVGLPATVALSAEALNPGGAYLLDNGVEMYLWLGRAVPPQLLQALFALPSLDGVDLAGLVLTPQGNDYSARVCAIVRSLRSPATQSQKLRVVRDGAGDAVESRFHWHLMEDRQSFPGGTASYSEYVQIVFREASQAAPGVAPGGAAQ